VFQILVWNLISKAFHSISLTAGNRSYCMKDISYWIKRKGKNNRPKNQNFVEKLKRYLDLTESSVKFIKSDKNP